jgi:hypothetical protein
MVKNEFLFSFPSDAENLKKKIGEAQESSVDPIFDLLNFILSTVTLMCI